MTLPSIYFAQQSDRSWLHFGLNGPASSCDPEGADGLRTKDIYAPINVKPTIAFSLSSLHTLPCFSRQDHLFHLAYASLHFEISPLASSTRLIPFNPVQGAARTSGKLMSRPKWVWVVSRGGSTDFREIKFHLRPRTRVDYVEMGNFLVAVDRTCGDHRWSDTWRASLVSSGRGP